MQKSSPEPAKVAMQKLICLMDKTSRSLDPFRLINKVIMVLFVLGLQIIMAQENKTSSLARATILAKTQMSKSLILIPRFWILYSPAIHPVSKMAFL